MKKRILCLALVMVLTLCSGCGMGGAPLSKGYEAHMEKREKQIMTKTLGSRWKSIGSTICVVPREKSVSAMWPGVKEALSVNNQTKQLVTAQNVFTKAYPASVTKIMTALLTLENGNLDDTVTIDKDITFSDAAAVSIHLKKGDKITVEALLNALLVMSANDSAVALGRYVAGSDEKFITMMNQRAKELGATHTHFANPNGLHDNNHYTTAYDLYLIFRELIKHNEFAGITGQSSSYIEYSNSKGIAKSYDMASTNQYIAGTYHLPYQVFVIGGKTGTTSQAGSCLILLTKNAKSQECISVILHASNKAVLYTTMSKILSKTNGG